MFHPNFPGVRSSIARAAVRPFASGTPHVPTRQDRRRFATAIRVLGAVSALLVGTVPAEAAAQQHTAVPAGDSRPTSASPMAVVPLDTLIREAEVSSPALRAARARLSAAERRIAPAGTRPDPMLMASAVNVPLTRPGFSADEMTMKMVGISQSIPYPGKLGLRRRAATLEADAGRAAVEAVRLDVVRAVKDSYYDIAFADQALALLVPNGRVLNDLARVAEARYASGVGGQHEVLTARLEATRLSERASDLMEQRRSSVAQLNAALARASETSLESAAIPARLAQAAVARDASQVRFAATTLGARAAGSPFPPLATLQTMAAERSPMLRQHQALIATQAARVELARMEFRPDVDVSLQYGQRQGRSDMVTAQVSIPLLVHRRTRQDAQLAEANAELQGLEAEHMGQRNAVYAEVARLVSDAERSRTQLALHATAILPQGRAAVDAALSSYRAGQAGLAAVLDAQSALFTYQTTSARALTDFAKSVAALEQVIGTDLIPETAP